jgi:hypothetical protein
MIYTEELCERCYFTLKSEFPHPEMSQEELKEHKQTLKDWIADRYYPVRIASPLDTRHFSHHRCELCGALPGDRINFEFNKEEPLNEDEKFNPNGIYTISNAISLKVDVHPYFMGDGENIIYYQYEDNPPVKTAIVDDFWDENNECYIPAFLYGSHFIPLTDVMRYPW